MRVLASPIVIVTNSIPAKEKKTIGKAEKKAYGPLGVKEKFW